MGGGPRGGHSADDKEARRNGGRHGCGAPWKESPVLLAMASSAPPPRMAAKEQAAARAMPASRGQPCSPGHARLRGQAKHCRGSQGPSTASSTSTSQLRGGEAARTPSRRRTEQSIRPPRGSPRTNRTPHAYYLHGGLIVTDLSAGIWHRPRCRGQTAPFNANPITMCQANSSSQFIGALVRRETPKRPAGQNR